MVTAESAKFRMAVAEDEPQSRFEAGARPPGR